MNDSLNRVQQYKTDVAFKTLVEGLNDNLFYVPKYQRKFRWKLGQVQELARSLVRGYPIPPIYAYRNRRGQLEILDGQQRLMSLFFYYIGKYKKDRDTVDLREIDVYNRTYLETLEELVELQEMKTILNPEAPQEEQIDITYQNLPDEMRKRLDYTNLSVIELRWDNPDNRTQDLQIIFKNLNKQGILLEQQEIRNGIFDSPFYDMLREINMINTDWRKIWAKVSSKEEDMEFLLRLCTVRRYVEFSEGDFVIHAYNGKYSEWLDKFSEEAINMNQEEIADYRRSLEDFFSKFKLNKTIGSQKALLESIYVVFEKCNIIGIITDDVITRLKSSEFIKSTSQGTVKKNIMIRRWRDVYGTMGKTISENSRGVGE
ncbi:MAG: DUF262 domain-containing protein [Lachnospiraceae bacterium]|nr:DUF262 domain-containing protein [Lachnospiraceae bacterium]